MSTTDTFLTVDKHLIIVGWTTGMQEIFGYEPSEILGKHVFVLVPPEKADAAVAMLTQVKQKDGSSEREKWLSTMRANGEVIAKTAYGQILGFESERLTKSGERVKLSIDLLSIKNMTGDHCATQISPTRR
jgi:PAS domain S-box-containing protein